VEVTNPFMMPQRSGEEASRKREVGTTRGERRRDRQRAEKPIRKLSWTAPRWAARPALPRMRAEARSCPPRSGLVQLRFWREPPSI